MFKKLLLTTVLCLPFSVLANETFTLKVNGLENGSFSQKHLLSANYGFGCSGQNLSPEIEWKNAPKGTKSFVLTVYDKDAPTGLGWVHWEVVNIPANVTKLPLGITAQSDKLPKGALQTRTDFGVPGYGGACPPVGEKHRYEFTLTALKIETLPNVTAESTPALVGFFTNANALGKAQFTVEYGR
ncbi:YbhB/YbcL family Raf kinase inhibitor-like protein [Actinobacillus porcinus]|uniref:YbhB/YbcL family Raf kinase inhibitor-like protein n=1 Tax=Actinobacillus porcinus TaxID=51048 RepID=UPI002A914436|nr:YbhB/YbcL family Raf kinase inhibitor-like protein [Actinobacillus porcinus]MDY6216213.1 YbhB/YbcL family Raf kinase inhibitor-like protein [Actinobacillus porcinus]